MPPTATRTPPDLNAKLADARQAGEELRLELGAAELDLAKALERQDYPAADAAKQRAAEVRPHLALAQAEEQALQSAIAALDTHRQDEQAAAVRQATELQARADHASAMAAEREASEQTQRHFAEAVAGVAAVRTSLRMALQAERMQTEARRSAHQALVTLGEREPSRYVSGTNWATGRIEASRLLTELLSGKEF